MADPKELELVYKAIRCGVIGCCVWDEKATRRIRRDPTLDGLTPEYILQRLQVYVKDEEGVIEQVKETRDPHRDKYDYYYKAIVPEPGFPHGLFVEFVLTDEDEDYPTVTLVNAHSQRR